MLLADLAVSVWVTLVTLGAWLLLILVWGRAAVGLLDLGAGHCFP